MVFTRENQLVIIFIVFTAIVGSGVALVRHFHPGFFMGKPDYIADEESRKYEAEKANNSGHSKDSENDITDSDIPASSENKLIDLNSATAQQLQQLPRIGPVMSERIIEYRKLHKGFISIEQIMEVRGIGKKTFERLKDKVTVSPYHESSQK